LSQTLLGGRYRLGERIALGGAAEIFAATDVRLGRPVAVKVLMAEDRGPELVGRFAEEARLLAAVGHPRHPHLVPLLDAGRDGPRRYLVMPLIQGEDLARIIRQGPLPPAEVARVGVALADALAHIHALGIVHRDLKPANVLMELSGGIYLADFGIAHAWDGPAVTAPGCVVGTAGYLAPEQARGDGARAASDIFSLGLVLLEALTGRPEYTGPPLERLAGVVNRAPRIPDVLSPQWRALLAAMLCADPDRRPTAQQLRSLICPVEPPTTSAPARHRRPAPAGSAAEVLGAADPCERDVYRRNGWTTGVRRRPERAGRHGAIWKERLA
jgi:serine/threonine protein kinase